MPQQRSLHLAADSSTDQKQAKQTKTRKVGPRAKQQPNERNIVHAAFHSLLSTSAATSSSVKAQTPQTHNGAYNMFERHARHMTNSNESMLFTSQQSDETGVQAQQTDDRTSILENSQNSHCHLGEYPLLSPEIRRDRGMRRGHHCVAGNQACATRDSADSCRPQGKGVDYPTRQTLQATESPKQCEPHSGRGRSE